MPPRPEILSNIYKVSFVIEGYILTVSKDQDAGIFFYCHLVCYKYISKVAANNRRGGRRKRLRIPRMSIVLKKKCRRSGIIKAVSFVKEREGC